MAGVRTSRLLAGLIVVAALVAVVGLDRPSSAAGRGRFTYHARPGQPPLSGVADPTLLTTDAGVRGAAVNGVTAARAPSNIQVNGDNKAHPGTEQFGNGVGETQNETSIAVNPKNPSNAIGAANDYEPAVDSTLGLYASFDGGRHWPYSRHGPQIITPDRRMLGAGDPVVAFDRDGIAYAAMISFGRADCDSYIAVSRSTDGGVTWSVPTDDAPAGSDLTPGDGIVMHNGGPDDCQVFHDKDAMTVGPRPEGASLVKGTDPGHVSADRLYVTWTRFAYDAQGALIDSPIFERHSDDQGRHWSPPHEISGRAPSCKVQHGDADARACDEDQFSSPVVDPRTGRLYVAFENYNTAGDGQYFVVHSDNGGQAFGNPSRITSVADGPTRYPTCAGSQTLDFMCARLDAAGNLGLDPRTGALYLTWSDNRNGTAADTNNDVFVATSTDGGQAWSRPNDVTTDSVDDQFFPWLSVAPNGIVVIAYFDRRYSRPKLIDTSLSISTDGGRSFSTTRVSDQSWNPDLAFRQGLFIGDYNGLATTGTTALPLWTDARFAEPNTAGNNPPNQQADVMVAVAPLPGGSPGGDSAP